MHNQNNIYNLKLPLFLQYLGIYIYRVSNVALPLNYYATGSDIAMEKSMTRLYALYSERGHF